MKKPEALTQLLEELRLENLEPSVETTADSTAVVYPDISDKNGIKLTAQDCQMVFATRSTAKRFLESLGDPEEASLVLFEVGVPDDVLDLLEKNLLAVDEG